MGILANLGLTNNKKSVKAQYAPAIMDVPYGTWFGNNNFPDHIFMQQPLG